MTAKLDFTTFDAFKKISATEKKVKDIEDYINALLKTLSIFDVFKSEIAAAGN